VQLEKEPLGRTEKDIRKEIDTVLIQIAKKRIKQALAPFLKALGGAIHRGGEGVGKN